MKYYEFLVPKHDPLDEMVMQSDVKMSEITMFFYQYYKETDGDFELQGFIDHMKGLFSEQHFSIIAVDDIPYGEDITSIKPSER